MNNTAFLKGNIAQPPYFDRVGDTKRPFLRFYLAVDRPGGNGGADFVRVVSYDDLALLSYPYLRSGSELFIGGRIRTRKFTDRHGRKKTVVEVVASDITFIRNIEWEAGNAARDRIQAEREEAQGGDG